MATSPVTFACTACVSHSLLPPVRLPEPCWAGISAPGTGGWGWKWLPGGQSFLGDEIALLPQDGHLCPVRPQTYRKGVASLGPALQPGL